MPTEPQDVPQEAEAAEDAGAAVVTGAGSGIGEAIARRARQPSCAAGTLLPGPDNFDR